MKFTRIKGSIALAALAGLTAACGGGADAPTEAEPAGGDTAESTEMTAAAGEDGKEKCYGIAKAGEDEGVDGAESSDAGTSMIDYQGNAWTYVDEGKCVETERGDSGTMGSLEPTDNL